jgi:hypothetical protein
MAKVRTDWTELRNDLEVWMRQRAVEDPHRAANELTSRIRGNRLPVVESNLFPQTLLHEVNAMAHGASIAIKAARAG